MTNRTYELPDGSKIDLPCPHGRIVNTFGPTGIMKTVCAQCGEKLDFKEWEFEYRRREANTFNRLSKLMGPNGYNKDVAWPDWEKYGKCGNDWRGLIPTDIREMWDSLPTSAQMAFYIMAQWEAKIYGS